MGRMPSAPFPPWGPPVAALLALGVILFPILYGIGMIGLYALFLRLGGVFFLEISFAAIFFRRVRSIDASVRPLAVELPVVHEILGIMDRESFSSPRRQGSFLQRGGQLHIRSRLHPYFFRC